MGGFPTAAAEEAGPGGDGRPRHNILGRCLATARRTLGHYRRVARNRLDGAARRLRISAARAVCVYRLDPRNIGDLKCGPRQYFDSLKSFQEIDIFEFQEMGVGVDAKVVIAGGGGMLANDFCARGLERMAAGRGTTLICWGAGHNAHGSDRIGRIDLLDRFDLVGLRDYGHGYDWVPCVSCMDPAFDRPYPIEHEVAIYEHHTYRFSDVAPSVPRLSNDCPDFGKVLAFLGSAETVVTTSYHGAYWATLLGRKVVVADPFSSKFGGFKHPPVICSSEDWRRAVPRARAYPESLAECRVANLAFADKVDEAIARHGRGRLSGGRRRGS